MDSDPSVYENEVAKKSSPPWLPAYRRYLYFALVLSAIGLLLSATVWGGKFSTALLNVVVAAFVLRSLKYFGEKWITILHLAVNGATLLTAIGPLIGLRGTGLQPLMSLLAVDFGVLPSLVATAFGMYISVSVELVFRVAFTLISAYWLKNLYLFMSTTDRDLSIGDQVAQRSDNSDAAVSEMGSYVRFMAKPFLLAALVATVVVVAVFATMAAIGLPGLFLAFALAIGGIILFIGAIASMYRIFRTAND